MEREEKMRKTKRERQEELKVYNWNSKYPVGQKVIVTKDGGEEVETETSHPSQMMCGTAVGWFKGISGAYQLDRAKAIEGPNDTVSSDDYENQQLNERSARE